MADFAFPLLTLYTKLRDLGFLLTLQDYDDLLEVIAHPDESGFVFQDRLSIIELCSYLWVKSPEQEKLFQTTVEQFLLPSPSIKKRDKSLIDQPTSIKTPISQKKNDTSTVSTSSDSSTPQTLEEQTVIKAIPRIAQPDDRYQRFTVPGTYLPASREQMQQNWLTLHTPSTQGIPTDIDINATLREINRKGMLFDVVMKPKQQAGLKLILLIDQLGSMIPFQGLARQLKETAIAGGYLAQIETYYFHNCPIDELYLDPQCWEEISISRLLAKLEPERTAILIFSDAGAARGHHKRQVRVADTIMFVRRITPYCQTLVWLNPLPKQRWKETTAQEIDVWVDMYECHRAGLTQAIARLKI